MAGRRKRKGLRSQKKFEEEFGDLAGESAHELSQAAVQPIHELVGLMKDFMSSQKEREEGLLEEIRNLRGTHRSPSPSARSAVESTSVGSPSPRLALPTPVAPRRPQGESTTLHRPLAEESGQPDFVPPPEWRPYSMEPKIPPYQSGEDIENYLLRFERIARTWKWPEEEWACRLVPLLTGRALEAYSAMDEERAHCYEDLKEALLAKFDISPETYRMQFRSNSLPPGESPLRPIIVFEDSIAAGYDRRTTPKRRSEHEPADGLTAAKLAVQYLNARKGGSAARSINASHRATAPPSFARRDATRDQPGISSSAPNQRGPGKELVCFYCQQTGHKASVCPVRKAKVSGACYPPRPESGSLSDSESAVQRYKNVLINGQEVIALLDTGSFMSLIKRSSVPVGSMDYSKTMDVLCVHGDSHPYPTVEVTVTAKDQPYLVTVGVVEHLPVDAILGWDLPVLMDLLTENDTSDKVDSGWKGDCVADVSCPVLTRAQAKTGVQPLPDLDSSLCEGGAKGPRKTRRQRRFEKEMYSAKPVDVDSFVWDVPENISVLQCHDETLKCLFAKVGKETKGCLGQEKFVIDNGVLYIVGDESKRLVVPLTCRSLVMHLAHTVPWAGHLGRHKTFLRVSSRFYWPSMYTDIQKYCATCPTCQKTCPVRKSDRAFLQPLPVISTPFRRIAMDIVGPLVKSSSGHQYILVISDYATRFPEAFPLRTITAPAVLRALIQLFSRVGLPDEILTDQGTNFTSRLMHLFQQQLGITSIKTSPYHPQTDGLVERFNQTLKRMLQKFVDDTGKDWDRWLPFVLFAYREVPQASTGFSPFELLYGWDVQGPLDLLRTQWEGQPPRKTDRNIVQFVLEMRERLSKYLEEAEKNLQQAQKAQKAWYDRQARSREFLPGQKVLLLLPSSTHKLLAKWQGPYVVSRKMGPVTYEVLHPEKKKPKQTYHVNLLKAWMERSVQAPAKVLFVEKVHEDEDHDELEGGLEGRTDNAAPLLVHLPPEQAAQLLQTFKEVSSLFNARPGKTTVVEHVIRLKDSRPIRQRPYRVPQQLVGKLHDEIQEMLRLGVIEPSNSEWSSPVVIVFKKDGSLRICIDFRKLNSVSEFDAYPMPRIDDLLEKIGAAKYITTLDLCKGYWQVPLEESSRPYTAFQTPAGLFQFTVMPFGLHGAPATFQRLMDRVLQGCEHCSAAYLDDVVIFSETWEDHIQHLSLVLKKIEQAGLTLNPAKCEWARQETRYLGYHLGQGEVRPQVDKVEAILKSPRPHTKKEVRSFLGLAGWYRRFVPQFATIAAPLTALTTKDQRNPVIWTEDCETAFRTLKAHLCSSPVLKSPDFSKRFLVQVDASMVGLGAVLAQEIQERNVRFFT
ncbi:hypothetical protein WMY93_033328 [Mugilogobius chulae]|uniref:Gypsy retrotransposon integrase-like protein 1 n=1 Tax=Mugilogobius chulae TaxID=88201 RepID=A0AAW0MIZ8_9GOBI